MLLPLSFDNRSSYYKIWGSEKIPENVWNITKKNNGFNTSIYDLMASSAAAATAI